MTVFGSKLSTGTFFLINFSKLSENLTFRTSLSYSNVKKNKRLHSNFTIDSLNLTILKLRVTKTFFDCRQEITNR
jgi:hypothetical protein